MDFRKIEEKWQKAWEEKGIFRPDPGRERKFYVTVAYPYPSGGMHIGHLRTYSVPDIIARFKRMQGYNVLFPMAWHVTGTPIIGALKRLKDGEEKQLHVLKNVYKMSDEELVAIKEPMDYATYFIEKHYKKGMRMLGLSIDWRREFTTNDVHYNKFIEWQYLTLKSMGLVKKGLHPVKWCLNDKNPVTTHDLLEGEDADINEFVLVKFLLKGKERVYVPMATLRPETVYGVTNAWVNPESTLVEAEVDGEKWIVSEECAEKLAEQNRKVSVKRKIRGAELVGKKVRNPVTRDEVMLLPADFVDPDNATGIVMSVPSHAPFDYAALEELQRKKSELRKWKLPVKEIESIKPVELIETPGLPRNPGIELVRKAGIMSQKEREKLEELTKEVYRKEFHSGVLNRNCGKYAGKRVSEAKNAMVKEFSKKGVFDEMLEFSEKVKCRCGGKVIVAKKKSWFLTYGNREWKNKVRKLLKSMKIIPDYMRSEYESTIEWLENWPCIRNFGLGTKLPWDKDFIIEPLSDSTIYMAYYTIAHLVRKFRPEQLTPEFFEYVFRGKGRIKEVSAKTGIDEREIEECRKSFEYWYPLEWRFSAHELVQNHLTFFLFHHAALFERDKQPKGIATWGVGLLEGGKMSSSKGNVVLASEAIEQYGADTVRLFLLTSVEPWQDFDWRAREVENYRKRVTGFYNRVMSLYRDSGSGKKGLADRWLESAVNRIIKETTQALEGFQTRKAGLACFFGMDEIFRWYVRRAGKPKKDIVIPLLRKWIQLMAPFTPHVCEELWSQTGGEGLVVEAGWPQHEEGKIDPRLDKMEELVKQTLDDIHDVLRLVKKKPKEIMIYVSPHWKHAVYTTILQAEGRTPEEIIRNVMKSPEGRKYGKEALRLAQSIAKDIAGGLKEPLTPEEELSALSDAREFFEKELGCSVKVMNAVESDSERASRAEPGKPGIEVVGD